MDREAWRDDEQGFAIYAWTMLRGEMSMQNQDIQDSILLATVHHPATPTISSCASSFHLISSDSSSGPDTPYLYSSDSSPSRLGDEPTDGIAQLCPARFSFGLRYMDPWEPHGTRLSLESSQLASDLLPAPR